MEQASHESLLPKAADMRKEIDDTRERMIAAKVPEILKQLASSIRYTTKNGKSHMKWCCSLHNCGGDYARMATAECHAMVLEQVKSALNEAGYGVEKDPNDYNYLIITW
eukprot:TRINITY_DN72066_c0_g1_i1.p1 TRINITY_DN72066_c0_g1~~TRINITY_DN72066_c0_g1_i1.p1  ORF type:complete len:109 (+),score=12.19 TRINITY_DN72066_c0_g1_i1:1-327(+)